MQVRALNATRQTLLADPAVRVTSFFGRLRGLLGRSEFRMGDGLQIVPCDAIHTFFMRFPIDVLFLSAEGTVLRMEEALPPWRGTLPVAKARSVLELPAGVLKASGTRVGDTIRFENMRA